MPRWLPVAKAPKPKNKPGRPTSASLDDPAVVHALVGRISSGEGIVAICKSSDMPAESTVYLRMAQDTEFRRVIAQAREAQQDREADKTVELADEATIENWQVIKLRIWARQWRAGKLAPKRYGDKLELSGDKDNPLTIAVGVEKSLDAKLDRLIGRRT